MGLHAGRSLWLAMFAACLSGLGGCDVPVTTDPNGNWQGVVRAFSVPAQSMAPTLQAGDYFLSDTRVRGDLLKRGTIVVYQLPNQPGTDYVKRIIGLPGDTVEIREGRVMINANAIDETYLQPVPPDPAYAAFTPVTVPADMLYVLGDNRNNSYDSRFARHGFVPVANVIAIPTYIYWSADIGRIGTRVR